MIDKYKIEEQEELQEREQEKLKKLTRKMFYRFGLYLDKSGSY